MACSTHAQQVIQDRVWRMTAEQMNEACENAVHTGLQRSVGTHQRGAQRFAFGPLHGRVGAAQYFARPSPRNASRGLGNVDRKALAREYPERDFPKAFRANGSTDPASREYRLLRANGFRDYRLIVDGLVDRPLSLSLADLKRRPSREQITKHDCVEGWTSIGKWKGARLSAILNEAGLKPQAKFIVFPCFDALDQAPNGERYYESIDVSEAFHEQT